MLTGHHDNRNANLSKNIENLNCFINHIQVLEIFGYQVLLALED